MVIIILNVGYNTEEQAQGTRSRMPWLVWRILDDERDPWTVEGQESFVSMPGRIPDS